MITLIDWLDRYARFVDHLAVRNVAQGAPLGGGSTLHVHFNGAQTTSDVLLDCSDISASTKHIILDDPDLDISLCSPK